MGSAYRDPSKKALITAKVNLSLVTGVYDSLLLRPYLLECRCERYQGEYEEWSGAFDEYLVGNDLFAVIGVRLVITGILALRHPTCISTPVVNMPVTDRMVDFSGCPD
jgi:hypothetical protein